MAATQLYTVLVIAGDLRRAELVKQYADTFDYLDSVSQDMFNRIAIRLNVYRAQLNKFNERIQHATAHIDRIKGSKRAIQVHSSARYPVEQNRSTYTSIFEYDDNEDTKPPVLHYSLFRLNETVDKFIDPNDKGSKSNDDTLIVLKQYENNFIQKTKRNVLTGLGKPPANIKSVVSFLKYNTHENPYTQSTKIDPLSVSRRIHKQVDEPAQPRISETPLRVFCKMSERPTKSDFGYNPASDLAPQLILPDNLPELDNYATFDDNSAIDWTKQQMTSIAPSFSMSVLPDINDLSSTTPTAPSVEPLKTTVPVPPPIDITPIIPLKPDPTSVSSQALSSPSPVPSLPLTDSSILIPPSSADKSQVSANNQAVVDDNLLHIRIRQLKPTQKSDPIDKATLSSSQRQESSMNKLEEFLHNRRVRIIGDDDDNDDDEEEDDEDGSSLLPPNFVRPNRPKPTTTSNPLARAPLPSSQRQESSMNSLNERLQRRSGFITRETSSSSSGAAAAERPIAAPTRPLLPSTGSAMTDTILAKAREVGDLKRRQQDESDNSNDNDKDWE